MAEPVGGRSVIHLPSDLHNRLKVAAEERGVSISWLTRRAIGDFLDRLIPADEMRWTHPRDKREPDE